jgi:hypothetical protein
VNKKELKTDQAVLKNLADKEPTLRIIRENAENDPADNKHRIPTVSKGQTRDRLEGNVARMLKSTHLPVCAYVARTRRS